MEWVNGSEPQMRQRGFQDLVHIVARVEPLQKRRHLLLQFPGWRGFVVNALVAYGAGDDLHRPPESSRHAPILIFVIPLRPVVNNDACQANSRSWLSGSR